MSVRTTTHRVGIIINGATSRIATNQHLLHSLIPIIEQGGIKLNEWEYIMPDLILVDRDEGKLRQLSARTGITKYTTNLDEALDNKQYSVYFDARLTGLRADGVLKGIEAGKHIYCEKPTATDTDAAIGLYNKCRAAGLKHGVVQDKLWLPGLIKLKRLIENDFFGDILSVKADFGYWGFEGNTVPAQRPSWSYRKEDGGGIILDMFSHWRYILDNLFGQVKAVSCLGSTFIPHRVNEAGRSFICTAEDSAFATFELEQGIIAQFNSSWATRVRREDLLTMQVDGTKGSAVAGLRHCFTQHYCNTPRPTWNPDMEQPINFFDNWSKVPEQEVYENAFKAEWQLFLRHVVKDEHFHWNLKEGAKGVQLAEKATQSWQERRWITVPDLFDTFLSPSGQGCGGSNVLH
ncbi:Gfo/Idh/MocA family protein [Chitinophaga nivalis]|uniref:Gfo/Idh/MocA family oxidoreductase n=1 Tax=Chitinophaga nivalis TaxID=2991709 RepID=A0ABT3II38_9BACT|nr:Gfo/Idh/MocA family oxidoreductase [Chitinophaga nivalis]MCW3466681.1 Gfo/Idh/MocA family oxidoreductase [Chitinophaga nivalis]MCW3483628.1 Gfo/Idh/MocA family oxidoreductase [Chitinophaga nivalis]